MASEEESHGVYLELAEDEDVLQEINKSDIDIDKYQQRVRELSFSPDNTSREWKSRLSTPLHEDSSRLKMENSQLKHQIKQLQTDLQSEQDSVAQLRRRLNVVERERLEVASKANTELSELESQNAKLRAQLEKGEATKASLEFELTRTKRDLAQVKHSFTEKESALYMDHEELKKRLAEYSGEVKRLGDLLQQEKHRAEEIERRYQRELELKELEMSKCQTEQDVLQAERDKLDALLQQNESTITDLNEKIQDLEGGNKKQNDHLRRTLAELEYEKEREDRMKKDLENSLHRLRALEDSIETERAAHLETKFNSEIVQLRVKDLEGALEVEKSANNEANKAIDRLTKQIRELEQAYDAERSSSKQLSEKYSKLEKDHHTAKKQMTSDLEKKKNMIENLSKELEIHQKNFTELKDELSKAKKRQIYLEETYGGSMRELELLLSNFQIDAKARKSQSKSVGGKKEGNKMPPPSIVLENLRLTLSEYRKKLDHTSDELIKMKKLSDGLTKEVDQCKEMIWAKDKALEDAQKNYTRTAKELNRVRSEYGELESLLSRLKVDMQSTASNQNKDRSRIQELSEEIMKLVKKHKIEEEEKLAFLHGMYQRLLSGRILWPTKEKAFGQLYWSDLTSMVYDQVSALVDNLQHAEEKMKELDEALKTKEDTLNEAQRSHEDQLNKLTSLTKERELSWQKQKEEIEAHYSQLLSEMQTRTKKSQTMADQAWEKIRSTGTLQSGLETECAELQNQLTECKKQSKTLLTACALFCGAFYPLCSRSNSLALQRRIMEDQLNNWDLCKERVELLVTTLISEMKGKQKNSVETKVPTQRYRNPILLFRKGAITVIAANRLRRFGQECCRCFVTQDSVSGLNSVIVCTGGVKSLFTSEHEEDTCKMEGEHPGETALLNWLSSSDLLSTMMSSMAELQDTLTQVRSKEKVGTVETRSVVNAARTAFTKLFDRLGHYYEKIIIRPDIGFRERSSLIRLLGKGLAKILRDKPVEDRCYLTSPQDLLITLQNQILDFTQRLHSVEVERRALLLEVTRLKEENEKLGPEKEEVISERDDVATTDHGNQYVPMEKFESVCRELNNALHREEQAQQLMQEQSKQLEELTLRMDIFTTEGLDKEHTLTNAIQGLAETKMELKKKEQMLRQVNKQAAQLEGEKRSLQDNLNDAEKALRTVARDKDILASYIKSVEHALGQVKREMNKGSKREMTLSKMLLNADLIPADVGKAGAELIACQNLVGVFVDTMHQSLARVKALEDEIDRYKKHINSLKSELNDALRRELDDGEPDLPTRDIYRIGEEAPLEDVSPQDDAFLPLREDSEISFNLGKSNNAKSPKKLD
ncbi:hypothetical protein ACJMK2_044153, partial [Sinanodonta woodiana]